MNSPKKFYLTILILLILYSVKVDLSMDSYPYHSTTEITDKQKVIDHPSFTILSYQMKPQDTFISVIDYLNPELSIYHFEDIKQDFQVLNPYVDITDLRTGESYIFPKYN